MQDENIELLRKQIEMPLTDMEMVIRKDLLRKLLFSKKTKTKDKNDKEKCIEEDKLSREVIELATRIIETESLDNQKKLYTIIKENYQFLARRNFKEFLIAIEWNFSDDMKLYKIRKIVFDEWAEELQSLEDGELRGLSISAPPRTGKALSMDSGILTPDGWKLMKDIKEGDYVIASDGKPAEVLGVFPQGVTDLYRVTFDDRTSVKCSGDHLWTVKTRDDRRNGKQRTVKTTDMLKNVMVENGSRKNYSIDYVKPVEFENILQKDDLHPYILGALIGDGCFTKNMFTSADEELIKRFKKLMPKTDMLYKCNKYDYHYKKKEDKRNEKGYLIKCTIEKKLEEYGLNKKHSIEKFIPKKYLYSNVENRIELLRGLMDTDGYCESASNEFSTISKQLAEDVTELVRSLGGRVVLGEKIGKYKNKDGKIVECNKVYRLYIKMPINPYWLKRKAEKFIPREKNIRKYKYITSIERLPDEETQCIYVDHPDHLFVTDGYNLTHNTAIGTMFFMWCMLRHPEKSCFFCSHTRSDGQKSLL